jgi:processive 1,2-diacylglycerol beta-glucosyltransferase
VDNPSNHRRRKVLILSAAVGAGHVQAARAIQQQLLLSRPDVDVEHVECLEYSNAFFRTYYEGGFILGMTRFPWIYGLGYRLSDRPQTPQRSLGEKIRLRFERALLPKLIDRILDSRADLIVNTHFLAGPMIARLREAGRIRAPQITVVTDIVVHRWWRCEDVRHWFVPADVSAETLRRWGVEDSRITVSGIPVHPKWTQPQDRSKILAEWKLPSDRPIVLLSGGTEFTVAPVEKIARQVVQACPKAYVVVMAGRNKKLLATLSKMPGCPRDIRGMGFTDRAHELVEVCSLMATKPGGITTAECLSMGRPMILLRPVPGQEGGNAAYLSSRGAGIIARTIGEVVDGVRRLLENPEELARMSHSAVALYRPGTQTVVADIEKILDENPPMDS